MIETLDVQQIIENLTVITVLVLWLRQQMALTNYYRERAERHEEALIEAIGDNPKAGRIVKRLQHGVVEE